MASPSTSLVPRCFQKEAVAAALERNVVVRADTGSGKTFIAVLLIRKLTAQARPEQDSKHLVVFLTPGVSLVHQQAAVLRSQTLLRVKTFVGADGVDYWKRETWQEQLKQADAIVLTPQIFLNLLTNAYWSLQDVSLMVFDEAHHAGKRHPYAEIMRQFYHPLKQQGVSVPRILGLTASPIWNVKNPLKAVTDLETLLDCRILEVSKQHTAEMLEHAPKAQERLVQHDPEEDDSLEVGVSMLINQLQREVLLEDRWVDRLADAQKLFGTAGVELLIEQLARERHASQSFLDSLGSRTSTPVELGGLSNKVRALVDILAQAGQDGQHFHCIVFVQQRHHAQVLAALLRRIPSLPWVKSGALIGHGGRGRPGVGEKDEVKDGGMAVKEQIAVVEAFRTGEINLLVATRVAEEGLDFRKCNVVVRFDALTTITGYIQSRGRARMAKARYIVIAEGGSLDAQRYKDYVEQEGALHSLYADRPLEPDEENEPDLEDLPTYTTSAGARLTHPAAIPTLANFCQLLRFDIFTPLQKPHYDVVAEGPAGWSATLKLPKIRALQGQSVVLSETLPSKKAAKQNAAFHACIALHRAGALDDHLLPFREPVGKGGKDADGREVEQDPLPKQVEVVLPHVFGDAWSQSFAFLHVFELQSATTTARLGLVCGSSNPSLVDDNSTLYGRDGREIKLRIADTVKVEWSCEDERERRLAQLESLNRTVVLVLLNRKISDQKFYALWTPVTAHNEVDWALVESAFEPFNVDQAKEGDIVCVPYRRPSARLGRFSLVRQDVTSSSPTTEVEIDPPAKKRKMMERYNQYWLYVKVCYGLTDDEINAASEDKIVQFDPLHLQAHNALVPPRPGFEPVSKHTQHFRTLPSCMIRKTNLPLGFYQSFLLVPSLEHLITGRVHASLALAKLSTPSIRLQKLTEALTIPNCQLGYDLETLEWFGDSFLKVATSVHIYLSYPLAEEDRMTRLRENSVSNRFLRHRSLQSGHSSFLLPHVFRATTFVPFTSDDAVLSIEALEIRKKVPRRVLSDSVEATLGAAYVGGGGFETAFKVGDRLGLCFGGTVPWSERSEARALLNVEPERAGPGLAPLEAALGYTFKTQGRLLVQALTHRSYVGLEGYCLEREEYLGDALLDFWSTTRIYTLFLDGTPRSLTYKRAILVSNGVLALLAIKLELHKAVLHSSPALEEAMREAAGQARAFSWSEAVDGSLTWLWNPPKVLGDAFEALLAVIFIDSGMQLDPVCAVLDRLYAEMMPLLTEMEQRDPHSRLLMWKDAKLCRTYFRRVTALDASPTPACESASSSSAATPAASTATSSRPAFHLPSPIVNPTYSAAVYFHSTEPLLPPQTSSSKAVARQLAAKAALEVLESLEDSGEVMRVCQCRETWKRERAEAKAQERDDELEVDEEEAEGGEELAQGLDGHDAEGEAEEEENAAEGGEDHDPPIRVRQY
ncbi:hypothetical protein JCM8097_009245 [Rhodosporidiobolus ruineniae]